DGERPMPRPLPVPVRQAIWRRSQDGQDSPTIAKSLNRAPRTVRRLIRRFPQAGPVALIPSYDFCGAATPKPPESVVQAAVGLRREHPTSGAGLIPVPPREMKGNGTVRVPRRPWVIERGRAVPGVDFDRIRAEITTEQVLSLLGFEPSHRSG